MSKKQNLSTGVTKTFAQMAQIQPHAAGLDIGATEIVACIPGAQDQQLVRAFGTYTADLHALADWLVAEKIQTVAMESTGIYWIPIFEIIESRGIACCLISSRSIRRVPGRKSDVCDAQWIQTLHSYGLLQASFRPESDLVALRSLLRHRTQLVEHRAPFILHLQKALLQMNIQLSQVVTDITGETGTKILRAIISGERDPHKLAALRNYRCKKDESEIAKGLTGNWRAEHLFILQQSFEMYELFTQKIEACDTEIERLYALTRPDWPGTPTEAVAKPPKRITSKNAPVNAQEIWQHLQRIAGVDLTRVDGISIAIAQTILLEIGTDMSKFPSSKHFCSWLGLAPKNDISGGKVLVSHTLKNRNRAGQALRLAAQSVMRSDCAAGAFFRRIQFRLGTAQAIVATAHYLARIIYRMLKYKEDYQRISNVEYEAQVRQQQINTLQRRAAKLGLSLVPQSAES